MIFFKSYVIWEYFQFIIQIYNLFLIIVIIKKFSESWWAFVVCNLLELAKDVSVIISRAQSPHWKVFPWLGAAYLKSYCCGRSRWSSKCLDNKCKPGLGETIQLDLSLGREKALLEIKLPRPSLRQIEKQVEEK